VKCLIKLSQQSILMDINGDPDEALLKLKRISYKVVEIPQWNPGHQLADTRTGDIGYYVGPTEDGKRAVVQWSGGNPRFTAVDWDSVEPYEQFGRVGA
jgi:hypothetical protein